GTEALNRFEHYSGGSIIPQPIITGIGSRGTVASPTAIQTDDYLLVVDGRGYDGSSTNHGEYRLGITDTAAQINFRAANNWTGSLHGTYIEFKTTSSSGGGPLLAAQISTEGTAA